MALKLQQKATLARTAPSERSDLLQLRGLHVNIA
jgi:hypothetical protein